MTNLGGSQLVLRCTIPYYYFKNHPDLAPSLGPTFPHSAESEPVTYLNTENGILQNVALKHSATEKSFEAKTMAFTSVRKLRARKIRKPFSLSQNNCGMDWIIWEIVVWFEGLDKKGPYAGKMVVNQRLWNPYCISAGVALGRVLVIRMICQVESPKDMGPAASDTIAHPYHLSCVLCWWTTLMTKRWIYKS